MNMKPILFIDVKIPTIVFLTFMSRIKFIKGSFAYEFSVDSDYYEFKLALSMGSSVISRPVLPLNLPHYSLYQSLQQPASPVVFSLFQSAPLDPVNNNDLYLYISLIVRKSVIRVRHKPARADYCFLNIER